MSLREITSKDFFHRLGKWTKSSKYAITEEGYLIRFNKVLSCGTPVYEVLFEGWWEAPEACGISMGGLADGEPISFRAAEAIICKEEKALIERPKGRDAWIGC